MKALLCKSFGPPESLVLEEVPDPVAGKEQVVVTVRACGINFPDTLMIQNKYQFKPPMPFAPGGEVAGVVRSLGEGVTGLQVGDRVMAYMMHGGLAGQILLEASSCVKLPPGLDFVPASAFVLTYGTALYALQYRARLQRGESLLVMGAAGGTGIAAIEVGKALGARVIAAASSAQKLDLCRQHGADETINYDSEDFKQRIRDLTGGDGADVVFDPVGGPYSEQALRSTAWDGRLIVIGFAAGDIPRVPLNLPLLRNCAILGSPFGAFLRRTAENKQRLLGDLMAMFATGKLRPDVTQTYPLAQGGQAIRDMMERRVRGKVAVVMD